MDWKDVLKESTTVDLDKGKNKLVSKYKGKYSHWVKGLEDEWKTASDAKKKALLKEFPKLIAFISKKI